MSGNNSNIIEFTKNNNNEPLIIPEEFSSDEAPLQEIADQQKQK